MPRGINLGRCGGLVGAVRHRAERGGLGPVDRPVPDLDAVKDRERAVMWLTVAP
jgi:hypothetical protein